MPSHGVDTITMVEGEDFLFRPVLRGLLRAESLLDPNVTLGFVALCNEALDVEAENQHRVERAAASRRQ